MTDSIKNTSFQVLLAGQKNGREERLDLPVDSAELRKVCQRLGIHTADDLRVVSTSAPYERIGAFLSDVQDLNTLNMVAIFFSDMMEWEWKKMCAIMEMDLSEYGNPIDVMLNVAGDEDNFNSFDLIDAHAVEELGRYWARTDGFDTPADFDYAAYGRENMEDGGMFTQWGYIYIKQHPSMEYDSRNLPKEYDVVGQALQSSVCLYRFDVTTARERGELDLYRESNRLNQDCARAIDQAVTDSNYELYHYDLEAAAKSVVNTFGADRVSFVLANVVSRMDHDGRISQIHKEWAKEHFAPEGNDSGLYLNTHPSILDGFIRCARKELDQHSHLAAAELSSEQNYNMVGDGLINNEPSSRADLTDGQTYEEMQELAPETLPDANRKPSLLGQLEQLKSAIPDARKKDAPSAPER